MSINIVLLCFDQRIEFQSRYRLLRLMYLVRQLMFVLFNELLESQDLSFFNHHEIIILTGRTVHDSWSFDNNKKLVRQWKIC